MPRKRLSLFATAVFVLSYSTSFAQETGLPGNATSVREGHGDWQVTCKVPEGAVRCTMSQTQLHEKNRQRVLSIELTSGDEGTVNGVLVLPFGLDLGSGVSYRLDEGSAGSVQPFRTCLPVGCIVNITFDADTVAALRAGNQLNVIATADGGQEIVFSISLTGFTSAFDRVRELLL